LPLQACLAAHTLARFLLLCFDLVEAVEPLAKVRLPVAFEITGREPIGRKFSPYSILGVPFLLSGPSVRIMLLHLLPLSLLVLLEPLDFSFLLELELLVLFLLPLILGLLLSSL
jgi:hypothetical protein